jgi:hypothetical protein
MCTEARTVLRSVAADFFFNSWCLEILSDNRIRYVPRCTVQQPLLGNNCVYTCLAGNENIWNNERYIFCTVRARSNIGGVGSNILIIALGVVGVDENPLPGSRIGLSCSWGIQMRGPDPRGSESLEYVTVKYGHDSRLTRTREWLRWRGPLAAVPVVRERVRCYQTVRRIWSWASDGCLAPRQTGRLTSGRNITLTWLKFCWELQLWEAGIWGRGQFRNLKEGERQPLKPLPSNV